nr:Eco57I restriction-modification methylase domain-containing protein [uncultured Prevotella sp.]
MSEPIDILEDRLLHDEPGLLEVLLVDHSTQKNIFWATDSYLAEGEGYGWHDCITVSAITGKHGSIIMPRALKSRDEQQRRSRQMAEVFTPAWLVKKMNDVIDEEGSHAQDGLEDEYEPWQRYILTMELEITCGEAPFLTSRYDSVTAEPIPVEERVGLLDRKLQRVNKFAIDAEWTRWALLALANVYGYEWQGDNLLLAREALLATFVEYHEHRFGCRPASETIRKAAEIIAWNVWQMDGLKAVVPASCHDEKRVDAGLFETIETITPCPGCAKDDVLAHNGQRCRLRRWLPSATDIPDYFECNYTDFITKKYKTYHKTKRLMRFDFVVGNPPYQQEKEDNGRQPPVYDRFMDATYNVSDKVLLITPARFLFNAGQTQKEWNKKMLSDSKLKVLMYEQDSSKVFPNTDIKGGIAITYRSKEDEFGAIGVFTPIPELNNILHKVKEKTDKSLAEIIYAPTKFDLDTLYKDHPDFKSLIKADGKDKLLRTNIFERLSVFHSSKADDDIAVIGLISAKRTWRYIKRCYIDDSNEQLNKWKVLLPKSNGSGTLGELLSTPLIAKPLEGYTQTFIGIGAFETEEEAQAAYKYVVSKFARTMLGVLKITQDNPPEKWKYVPLQDFSSSSDIDWSQSIQSIDSQLYDKYGLSEEERNFIETHVKEMN